MLDYQSTCPNVLCYDLGLMVDGCECSCCAVSSREQKPVLVFFGCAATCCCFMYLDPEPQVSLLEACGALSGY